MKKFLVASTALLLLAAVISYAQYMGASNMPMWVYSVAPPSGQQATAFSVTRLTDGSSYYAALTDAQLRASALPVSGPITDAQLRASAVSVNAAQSGTWTVQPGNTANTTPWLVTANAGTNLNTSALLLDATFTGRVPTNGQKLMATSIPVVLPSDQSILPASEPGKWTCALDNIAATLTQCQAAPAAGQRLWLTSVVAISTTATAATFAIRQGTGVNCATSTAGLIPGATVARTMVLPANTAAPFMLSAPTGIGAIAANAICVIGVATNTLNITLAGYTTP